MINCPLEKAQVGFLCSICFDYAAINMCYIYYLNFTIISAIAYAVQKKFCQSELIITSVLIY